MNQALKKYQNTDLESAPKAEILDRLFDRLQRDFETGIAAMSRSDVRGRSEALDHANRILTELCASLDRKNAPDLCDNLMALYGFCSGCIMRATLEQQSAPLADAIAVIKTIQVAFREANGRLKQGL